MPFLKLLIALTAGILLQRYGLINVSASRILLVTGVLAHGVIFLLPFFKRYQYASLSGSVVFILFAALGSMLAWQKDIRTKKDWIGHFNSAGIALVAELDEPLSEKPKSWKAIAGVRTLFSSGTTADRSGRVILYFRKDSTGTVPALSNHSAGPGTRILFNKPLQEIINSGNPGGFDYKTYSLFRGITHQVFLQKGEFEVLQAHSPGLLQQLILQSRKRVLGILQEFIPGQNEAGLAEALLIGYKDDLDPELVKSYSNTGVVHIIAISGLHLGLIYWLLNLLLKPMAGKQHIKKWMPPLLIITGLWSFSFLAGAQPSVLRSALMFSFIVLGESLGRKTYIINSLAASAFVLLCINPYWLWDIGFQLSYAAVLSIVIFMRPVYNWFYFPNRIVDMIWKMNAVTLAAQVLTLPLCIYHFHQFPVYFLLSNFIAVPLSSAILLAEIFLCLVSFIPGLAQFTGRVISGAIGLMNGFIEKVESLPGSVWDGLQFTGVQVILLFLFIAGMAYWLLERSANGLLAGQLMCAGFVLLRSISFIESQKQRLLLVYNIPSKTAIDIIDGRKFQFSGDSNLLTRSFNHDFHLRPARTLYRTAPAVHLTHLIKDGNYISFGGKKILLLDENLFYPPVAAKQSIDLLIVSRNPMLYFKQLAASLDIKKVVFDASTPSWKVNNWKKECDSLRTPWHDVREEGAFVMRFR